MPKRKIINIDEKKCNGCGLCIPNCPEGAIQIIDRKARLISDLFCDGLGACLGHCPQGAISTEEREAQAYDEAKVMANIVKQGPNVIKAHLKHLKEHNELGYLKQAQDFLSEHKIGIPQESSCGHDQELSAGCPGSRSMDLRKSQGLSKPAGPKEDQES
jgi:ferredoxin